MNALLVNPFDFNCSVGPETVEQSSAGPCFPDPTVPAGGLFESAPNNAGETVVANVRPAPEAATVVILESAASLPALVERTDTAGAVGPSPAPANFSDTPYIPELFSAYAARRSMQIISPPLPKAERNIDGIALGAVRAALNLHPRDLDNDPPPEFLRSPSQAFMQVLFNLPGVNRYLARDVSRQQGREPLQRQDHFNLGHELYSGSTTGTKQHVG